MRGVDVGRKRNVGVLILEFPGMAVAMTNVEADDYAALGVDLTIELRFSGGEVSGILGGKMKQSVVACSEEGEYGLLAELVWFVRVLMSLVEGIAECPRGGGSGDD